MPLVTRDPVIDRWLVDEFGGEGTLLLSIPQLTALLLASRRPDPPVMPDAVLEAWHHALVRERLTVNQSEDAYIDRALAQGRT